MRRLSLAAAFAALASMLLVTAASAAAPDTDPLRALGWRVTWGSHGERAPLRAGSVVRVRVAPITGARRRQRAVRVSLVRLGENGESARTVASRKVRRGLFRVRLPRGDGARYALRVRVGARTLRERLTTARAVPRSQPAAPPAPQTPAPVAPSPMCTPEPGATHSATASFERPTAFYGEQRTFTVVNDGRTCLAGGYGYSWERLVDGVWQRVDTMSYAVPSVMLFLWPGQTLAQTATIESPVSMPPGRYRVTSEWGVLAQGIPGLQGTGERVAVHAYLDIVPGPGGGPAQDRCGEPDDEAAATAVLDDTVVSQGDPLTLRVTNTGPVCLKGSDTRYRIERYRADGTTEPVSTAHDYAWERGALLFQPGEAHVLPIAVENDVVMPPGRYRVLYDLWVPPAGDAVVVRTVQTDIEVTAHAG